MEATELAAHLASKWGLPALSEAEIDEILAFAGNVAHMSERKAAPIACWLAGRSGRSLDEATTLLSEISPSTPIE